MAIRYTVGNLAEATKVTTDVTEPPNPRADDSEHVHRIRILVIGASGVGKSALIATVSGQSLAVDHDLTSGKYIVFVFSATTHIAQRCQNALHRTIILPADT